MGADGVAGRDLAQAGEDKKAQETQESQAAAVGINGCPTEGPQTSCPKNEETGAGVEPTNGDFADLGLTTWLPRHHLTNTSILMVGVRAFE
jgi:hypothetical protein